MVKNKGACEECTRTCQLLHGSKRDLEPTVSRFFKIIIGQDFNEALSLPPKFAKNIEDLVGRETTLEDSRGICWTVTLSYYNNLLSFHKGWYEFSVDNKLKVGDLLIVNQIKGGHFVVLAFGRDGCEKGSQKLNSARKLPPAKKARISEKVAAQSTPCQVDVRKTEISKPLDETLPTETNCTPNCEAENKEELYMNDESFLIVDRDTGYVQSDYETWLYDLLSFEMQQEIGSAGKVEEHKDGQKVNPDDGQESVKFERDGNLDYKSTNEIMGSSIKTAAIPTNTNVAGNNKYSGLTCNMSFEQDNGYLADLQKYHPLPGAFARLDVIEGHDTSNVPVLPQNPREKSGNLHQSPQNRSRNLKKEIEIVKKVKVEAMEEAYGCSLKKALKPSTGEDHGSSSAASEVNKSVRIVAVDSLAVPSTVETNVTCLAETNGSGYIDLPDCWPSVTFPSNGVGRATVILEDPEGREWGGIYYQNFGYQLVVAPWHKINSENGIQPGDHLVFSMAKASLNKYKFDIVRKQ